MKFRTHQSRKTNFGLIKRHRRRTNRSGNRFGAAAVEFAVCLPLIILIVAGSIEGASLLFLRQALIQSAYEGAKVAIRQDSTNSDVSSIAIAVADGRRLTNVSVRTTPSDVTSVPQGELIRVSVTAPVTNNSTLFGGVFSLDSVSADAVMVKE